MANSFVRYTGNGSLAAYSISFTYRNSGDLVVTVAGVAKSITTHWTLNGAGTTLTFTSGNIPADGASIEIRRATSQSSQLVNYASGSVLTENDLDTDSQQAFFMSQEAIDDANDVIVLDAADFQWNANSKRIKSVANPTAAQDAVTKNYLESTWLSTSDKANITTLAGITSNITTVAGISSNVTSVAGNASNINTVAGVSANVTTVAGISSNVTTVAGIASNVTAVAADATDIGAVAGKATEIGRLGTADAVADMALLGTSDVVADMALLATTDVIADMALLATTDVIADMNTLATSDIVSDLNTLATSDIVTDINLLATSDIVTDLNTLATSDIVSDLNTLATSDIVTDINLLATSDVVADLALLATSDIVSDINTLATSDIVTDLALLATSDFVADLNTLATSAIVSDMDTLADIAANVTTVAGVSANVTTVAGVSANVTTVAGIAANVTTVAGVSANVTTVATNIAGVNSFAERYRVASSDPGSSLDEGDLAYNTTDNALKYYNGSAWASITAGLGNIVEDTTPQLGGDLDLNSNSIDFPSTANISDVKDEDDMASNSATMLATQQSIKAYVDAVDVPTTRNLIINGAMEVAQRGTSHTTAAQTYLLDRFYTYCATSGKTISQTSNAPDGFRKSIKLQRDNGSSATNPVYLSQPCESSACVGFAGQTITLSFYARKGANFSPTSDYINVAVHSGTGTDQSMMAGLTGSTPVIGTTNQALTTDWARYTFTSGSAVPTNSNQLVFQILHSPTGTAGANDWYEITGIQIEIGSSATDFVHEPFADTLYKCKRFYQKSFDYETAPFHTGYVAGHSEAGGGTGSVTTATEYVTVTRYERALRVDPTIVYYRAQAGGLSDGEWAYWDGADNLDTSGLPSAATTQIVLRTAVPFASGGKTTGRAGITQGNYTADSEL